MFNLSGSEIIVILLLALVILGPEKLPEAMRKAGRAYSELRKMASSFQSEVRSVIDEPMNELRGTADMLREATDFSGDDKKRATKKPGAGPNPGAGGATAAVGTSASEPAAEPTPDATPGSAPEPVHTPEAADTRPNTGAGAEGEDEDVVTRTLSGDVGPHTTNDEAGPQA